MTDRQGRFARFRLRPGNAAEVKELEPLLDGADPIGQVIADKAYDSGPLRRALRDSGIEPVIPPRTLWRDAPDYDAEAYKARHLVENAFADFKQFRGVATRYCKLALTFEAMVELVCWVINTKPNRRGPSPYSA